MLEVFASKRMEGVDSGERQELQYGSMTVHSGDDACFMLSVLGRSECKPFFEFYCTTTTTFAVAIALSNNK